MRWLRWTWPILLLVILAVLPIGLYMLRPERALAVTVLDKTVPFEDPVEHGSIFWLLGYLKIVRPDGRPYDARRDYLGAFPGPRPGDPPRRTVDLSREAAVGSDLLYLADTYGVYEGDLASGPAQRPALERSPRIYGGLTTAEAEAAVSAVASGTRLVAEFNTLASPTGDDARALLESALGVHWTRWIGRYFPWLQDRSEVPEWLRRDYERESGKRWEFRGPGYVLLQDDEHCEVLRAGAEVEPIGLTIERAAPPDPLLSDAVDGTPYAYWFDVVTPEKGTEVLATFRWHATASGLARLRARGLAGTFPAMTRRAASGRGEAFYLAGDFAERRRADRRVPLAGYLAVRRWLELPTLAPSGEAFYWRFYVPMMSRLLESTPHRAR